MAIDFAKMSPAQLEDWNAKAAKRANKYRAKRTEYNGVMYDSAMEASEAARLDGQLGAGTIDWWLKQVWVPLGPDFRTRIDFLVGVTLHGVGFRVHGIEVKGVETPEFKRVRKLWPKYGPFSLLVRAKKNGGWIEGKP